MFFRKAKNLIQEDNDETVPYCVASGNAELAVRFLCHRGQLQEAMLIATASADNNMAHLMTANRRERAVSTVGFDSNALNHTNR